MYFLLLKYGMNFLAFFTSERFCKKRPLVLLRFLLVLFLFK